MIFDLPRDTNASFCFRVLGLKRVFGCAFGRPNLGHETENSNVGGPKLYAHIYFYRSGFKRFKQFTLYASHALTFYAMFYAHPHALAVVSSV